MAYNQQTINTIIKEITNGATTTQTSHKYQISRNTISKWMKTAGIKPPSRTNYTLTEEQKYAFTLIANKIPLAHAARIVGMSPNTLHPIWHKHHPNTKLKKPSKNYQHQISPQSNTMIKPQNKK